LARPIRGGAVGAVSRPGQPRGHSETIRPAADPESAAGRCAEQQVGLAVLDRRALQELLGLAAQVLADLR
jgi:hypothetical protein